MAPLPWTYAGVPLSTYMPLVIEFLNQFCENLCLSSDNLELGKRSALAGMISLKCPNEKEQGKKRQVQEHFYHAVLNTLNLHK